MLATPNSWENTFAVLRIKIERQIRYSKDTLLNVFNVDFEQVISHSDDVMKQTKFLLESLPQQENSSSKSIEA